VAIDQTADLKTALTFVISRIEREATLSGLPLDEDERLLLNNLPKTPRMPEISVGDPGFSTDIRLRDIIYERLCALAKDARLKDLAQNPTSLDWDFAFSVAKLNGHPLSWLLQWAGVKQRKPWWDRCLLVFAALLFVAATMLLLFLVVDKPPVLWRWVVFVVLYVGLILFMHSASRRIERRQLKQNIERFRNASRFVTTVAR
jgi:hypothetical protein